MAGMLFCSLLTLCTELHVLNHPKILKTYFPFPLDWALQTLYKGYKLDPDTSAHHLVARTVWGKGSLRGVHKKAPQPFLPLLGPLEPQPFQFLHQTRWNLEASDARLTRV